MLINAQLIIWDKKLLTVCHLLLQAQDNIMNLPLSNGWGEKHRLFVKWKYVEAKVFYGFEYLTYLVIDTNSQILSHKSYHKLRFYRVNSRKIIVKTANKVSISSNTLRLESKSSNVFQVGEEQT